MDNENFEDIMEYLKRNCQLQKDYYKRDIRSEYDRFLCLPMLSTNADVFEFPSIFGFPTLAAIAKFKLPAHILNELSHQGLTQRIIFWGCPPSKAEAYWS